MGGASLSVVMLFLASCSTSQSETEPIGIATKEPVSSALQGAIAFDADLEEAGELHMYSIQLPGGDPVIWTSRLDAEGQPAWSPDGQHLAFSGLDDKRDNSDIYVMNADGSNLRKVTSGPGNDIGPDWSPDGQRIVFSRGYFREDPGPNLMDVFVVDLDGSNETQLTSNHVHDSHPDWSPDGKLIAFSSDRAGDADIWTMTPAGRNQTQLTDAAGHDVGPRWSPNGSQLAFSRAFASEENAIWLMAADGGNERAITDHRLNCVLPGWSPDGGWLVHTCGGADADLYLMRSSGEDRHAITHGAGIETNPAWGP